MTHVSYVAQQADAAQEPHGGDRGASGQQHPSGPSASGAHDRPFESTTAVADAPNVFRHRRAAGAAAAAAASSGAAPRAASRGRAAGAAAASRRALCCACIGSSSP